MNLKAGYPYSLIRHGIPFDYPKLEEEADTEVLVIGAGISGALVSHHLVEAGFDCMVIDSRSVGLGSTCASTSLIQYEIDTPLHELATRIGKQKAVKAYSLCAEAITGLERLCRATGNTSFRYKKSLQIARHKKDIPALSTESKIRRENGFKNDFLEEEELVERFGVNAPAALLTELAGDMDAYLLTHQLFQFNRRLGLRVFDRTGAAKFTKNPNGHVVTTTEGKQIRCRIIVYANGYEAAGMVPAKLVKMRSTYVTISESLSQPPPHWGDDVLIWTTGDPYLYMRTTQDNRILVGGRDEDLVSPARRDKLISSKAKALQKDFLNLFPNIPFKTEFSWTGIFASTPDGLPIIGELGDRRNEFIMLGYGGNGIPFSLLSAWILTDLISGRSSPDAGLFSLRRL